MTNQEAIEILKKDGWGYPENMHTEAVMMAIDALERQTPKKVSDPDDPIETRFHLFTCPTCRYHLSEGMKYYKAYDYCPHCGQAIDWPEVEE